MGLNEKGIKVIRKDGTSKAGNAYTMYSLMYSFKAGEEWKNGFLDAQFPKETNLSNKSKIKINSGFITGSEYNGEIKPKIVITDFDVLEGGNQPTPTPVDTSWQNVADIDDAELPFN